MYEYQAHIRLQTANLMLEVTAAYFDAATQTFAPLINGWFDALSCLVLR